MALFHHSELVVVVDVDVWSGRQGRQALPLQSLQSNVLIFHMIMTMMFSLCTPTLRRVIVCYAGPNTTTRRRHQHHCHRPTPLASSKGIVYSLLILAHWRGPPLPHQARLLFITKKNLQVYFPAQVHAFH